MLSLFIRMQESINLLKKMLSFFTLANQFIFIIVYPNARVCEFVEKMLEFWRNKSVFMGHSCLSLASEQCFRKTSSIPIPGIGAFCIIIITLYNCQLIHLYYCLFICTSLEICWKNMIYQFIAFVRKNYIPYEGHRNIS